MLQSSDGLAAYTVRGSGLIGRLGVKVSIS